VQITKTIRFAFKYGVPIIVALLVVLAVFDANNRWSVAQKELQNFPSQKAILVGMGFSYRGDISERSQIYQLLPGSGSPPRVLRISLRSDSGVHTKVESEGYLSFSPQLLSALATLAVVAYIWSKDMACSDSSRIARSEKSK